jgi:hypothetical protein
MTGKRIKEGSRGRTKSSVRCEVGVEDIIK